MEKLTKKIPNPELMKMVHDLITKKWHEQFPEDFIHCNTLDKDEYNSTKGFAYKTLISFLRAMDLSLTSNPDYKISDVDGYEFEWLKPIPFEMIYNDTWKEFIDDIFNKKIEAIKHEEKLARSQRKELYEQLKQEFEDYE